MAKFSFCEKVKSLQTVWHVLLLHWFPKGWIILIALTIAEALHQLGGGIAKVEGDRGKGALVV